jgi:type IV pilus assembly protein PilP
VIRAPDNKGYFVTVGTYMGENGGQVVDVAPDRLVIEEKYKDTEGNIVGKTLDLPLRRKEKAEQE